MQFDNPYAIEQASSVARSSLSERTNFIRKTYLHLAGAVMAFIAVEAVLLSVFPPATLLQNFGKFLGGAGWLVILGGFMVVSWLANAWAQSRVSKGLQYLGLSLYVVAEAILFLPLMAIALREDPSGSIPLSAGIITAVVFGGLTAMVFLTGADFSWLGRYLFLAGLVAFGIVLFGVFFPQQIGLGLVFSGLLVLLAAGYILYDTSNVMYHYDNTQHVAAALALFASVALMLWYVMRILIALQRD